MKFAFLATLMSATLALSACGGGGSSAPAPAPAPVAVANPPAFATADTRVGTGTLAVSGSNVGVRYTGWLYSTTAAGNKGTQFDSNVGGAALNFRLGANQVIAGFDQGVTGMRVGGTRTILIPSSMGYGAAGNGPIPPNAGLVFDVELLSAN